MMMQDTVVAPIKTPIVKPIGFNKRRDYIQYTQLLDVVAGVGEAKSVLTRDTDGSLIYSDIPNDTPLFTGMVWGNTIEKGAIPGEELITRDPDTMAATWSIASPGIYVQTDINAEASISWEGILEFGSRYHFSCLASGTGLLDIAYEGISLYLGEVDGYIELDGDAVGWEPEQLLITATGAMTVSEVSLKKLTCVWKDKLPDGTSVHPSITMEGDKVIYTNKTPWVMLQPTNLPGGTECNYKGKYYKIENFISTNNPPDAVDSPWVYQGYYSPGEGGVVCEFAGTNLTKESCRPYTTTYWSLGTGVTSLVATSNEAPIFGFFSPALLSVSTATSTHFANGPLISIVSGTIYTQSLIVKKGTLSKIQMLWGTTTFGSNGWASFDIDVGKVLAVGSGFIANMYYIDNDWWRVSLTGSAIASASDRTHILGFVDDTNYNTRLPSFATVAGDALYLAHAQMEVGAMTSPIVTHTTSASKGANYATIPTTNIFRDDNLDYTMVIRFTPNGVQDVGRDVALFDVLDSNGSRSLLYYDATSFHWKIAGLDGLLDEDINVNFLFTPGIPVTVVLKNNKELHTKYIFVGGEGALSSNADSVPVDTTLYLGTMNDGTNQCYGPVSFYTLNVALSDTKCILLSTMEMTIKEILTV
jgi:hypothetical protein